MDLERHVIATVRIGDEKSVPMAWNNYCDVKVVLQPNEGTLHIRLAGRQTSYGDKKRPLDLTKMRYFWIHCPGYPKDYTFYIQAVTLQK